jgi:hypothetical protein
LRQAYVFSNSVRLHRKKKLCREEVQAIQNHENAQVRNTGQGETRNTNYKRLKHLYTEL